jgi:hypothetical protein
MTVKSIRDVKQLPLACQWAPACNNAATGRRKGVLICDSCNKRAGENTEAKS